MVKIIQGGARSFIVRISDLTTGEPLDLTGVTALTTCMANTTGPDLDLGLGTGITILNAVLGKISIAVTSTQSAALATIDMAVLQLSITYGSSDPIIVQKSEAYQVIQSVC